MLLALLESSQWVGFNEKVIWKKLDLRCERDWILSIFFIENSSKLQEMVLKEKISWVTSSHLGQHNAATLGGCNDLDFTFIMAAIFLTSK
jgi:hypothetical protein